MMKAEATGLENSKGTMTTDATISNLAKKTRGFLTIGASKIYTRKKNKCSGGQKSFMKSRKRRRKNEKRLICNGYKETVIVVENLAILYRTIRDKEL